MKGGYRGQWAGDEARGQLSQLKLETKCAARGVSVLTTGPRRHRENYWSLETAEEIRHPIFLVFGKDQKGPVSAKKETEKP